MSQDNAVVEGVAVELTSADRTRSLPELIFSCVSAALADAGCALRDVDAVTVAGEDLIDGRSLSSMITGPAAGAYLRDEIRLSEDGLAALSLAGAQLVSGTFDRVLVAAWGRASEGDPERSSAHGFDPFTEQPLGLTAMVTSALRASAHIRAFGASADYTRAVDARRSRAERNPRANRIAARTVPAPFPLRAADLRVETDAVAAAVLCRTDLNTTSGQASITGFGHGTDTFHLGNRSLAELPSARVAVRGALAEACRELTEVHVAELGGRTVWDEVQLIESAGLAEPGTGFGALADDTRLNPSGGSAAGDCEPATGLVRFVEAVLQVTGRAGAVQLPGGPSVALVASGAALAGQTHTAVVVEA
ncbi:hypothetical protein ABZU76_14945 [Amycolatopsis sp. NPDC005232]|uniref:thiolase C-terminal domain-containing protein n=1 Tax=Amycolatopsis sp. NPDC005232 TaxID=3157027 RepID=UPI0033B5AE1C